MDYRLTEEQQRIQALVREFAEEQLAPIADRYDQAQEFPEALFRKMGDLGLLGIFVPEDYGGAGLDNVCWSVTIEELGRVEPGMAVSLVGHSHTVRAILMAGSEEHKQKYLPKIASGEWIAGFGNTEPLAGSDSAAIRTRAVRTGGVYVVNGSKCFCTNAPYAQLLVVSTKTDPDKRHKGISCLIVDPITPGFSYGKREDKMGCRTSPTGDLVFEDCHVPAENLLGNEGEGFTSVMRTLTVERIGNASITLGIAQGAFEEAVRYTRERQAFGQRVADFQGVQWMLADMAIRIHAARLMIRHAAAKADAGERCLEDVAMAKVMSNEMCMQVVNDALQLHGGVGYMKGYKIERLFRDAKLHSMGGGSTQIQRNILGRSIIKGSYI